MKGLYKIPGLVDLQRAYNALAEGRKIKPRTLVLYSLWSRFDPRLAEVLTNHFAKFWESTSPVEINFFLTKSCWPQVLPALLEFTEILVSQTAQRKKLRLFRIWKKTACFQVRRASLQQLYIGVEKFDGHRVQKISAHPLPQFEKWGFLATDAPLHQGAMTKKQMAIDRTARLEVLKKLMLQESKITVSLYLEQLRHSVSRRQAERDLKGMPGLKSKGFTRSKYYISKVHEGR